MAPEPQLDAREVLAERDLITQAALAGGDVAMGYFRDNCEQWEKPDDLGPVSEADMAVNTLLIDHLLTARPDYGLLSEETEDGTARLASERVFIIDPIDGTRSFLKGETGFAIAIAVVERGALIASVVHLPARGETYHAALGQGAVLNGQRIAPSARRQLAGASALGASASYRGDHWPGGLPTLERTYRHALQWRLCLIASGAYDLMATMRDAFEWDVAAGALIATEAGAAITDRDGEAMVFNSPSGKVPGILTAPPVLHDALIRARHG